MDGLALPGVAACSVGVSFTAAAPSPGTGVLVAAIRAALALALADSLVIILDLTRLTWLLPWLHAATQRRTREALTTDRRGLSAKSTTVSYSTTTRVKSLLWLPGGQVTTGAEQQQRCWR